MNKSLKQKSFTVLTDLYPFNGYFNCTSLLIVIQQDNCILAKRNVLVPTPHISTTEWRGLNNTATYINQ
jgi:hypothetical protein